MLDLKSLSDDVLLTQTKRAVAREREETISVLHHLKEVERRRLFAALSYSSMHDYATGELGYDSASAMRRIHAMHLLCEIPELEEKIGTGSLSLTTVSQAQSFFIKEDFSLENKKEIMISIEGLSKPQVERKLLGLTDQPEVHLHERVKPVTQELSEVKFYANDELLENLEKLKGILAHSHPGMTTGELIEYLAQMGLKKLNPAQQEVRPRKAELKVTSPENESAHQKMRERSRHISNPVRRQIWKRDDGQCTWTDPKTGKRCSSRHFLQIDHRVPFAKGGLTSLENLRILCATHNQYERERWFGPRKTSV